MSDFAFPPHWSFPPFFTLQPNVTTLSRQLALWSELVQSYCAHNRIFRLSITLAASEPPFVNTTLDRRLDVLSIRKLIDYMASTEGDRRAEWVGGRNSAGTGTGNNNNNTKQKDASSAWIYWRRPEEWGDAICAWIDETGQRGTVLTIYELRESETVQNMPWIGMDEEMFGKCLDDLTRRGKAQVFGEGGVKFF